MSVENLVIYWIVCFGIGVVFSFMALTDERVEYVLNKLLLWTWVVILIMAFVVPVVAIKITPFAQWFISVIGG